MALSIDRDQYIKSLMGGQGDWALAGAFPDTYSQSEVHQMLRFDPAQARQLLAQAGYPNGVDIDMTYPGKAYGDEFITLLQLFQAQLKQSRINIALHSVDKIPSRQGANRAPTRSALRPVSAWRAISTHISSSSFIRRRKQTTAG